MQTYYRFFWVAEVGGVKYSGIQAGRDSMEAFKKTESELETNNPEYRIVITKFEKLDAID